MLRQGQGVHVTGRIHEPADNNRFDTLKMAHNHTMGPRGHTSLEVMERNRVGQKHAGPDIRAGAMSAVDETVEDEEGGIIPKDTLDDEGEDDKDAVMLPFMPKKPLKQIFQSRRRLDWVVFSSR